MGDITDVRRISRRQLREWFLVLAAPFVWTVELNVTYWLVPLACQAGANVLVIVVNLSFMAITAAIGFVAWRHWERFGRQWPAGHTDDVPAERSRFMAVLGLLSAGLFGLFILSNLIPTFVIHPCLR
ncbi:MAG TPA: hypothetical protein VF190_08875 [Rhodothermales bacterium]